MQGWATLRSFLECRTYSSRAETTSGLANPLLPQQRISDGRPSQRISTVRSALLAWIGWALEGPLRVSTRWLLQPILVLMLYPIDADPLVSLGFDMPSPFARLLGKKGITGLWPKPLAILDHHNHRHSPNLWNPNYPTFSEREFSTCQER